jgi:hypothetical protein
MTYVYCRLELGRLASSGIVRACCIAFVMNCVIACGLFGRQAADELDWPQVPLSSAAIA